VEIHSGPDQGLSHRSRGLATCTIPKVVHGSAIESQYIVPPRLGGVQKDFIWVTVSNLIGYLSQFFNLLVMA
jgi:hypothetical protein